MRDAILKPFHEAGRQQTHNRQLGFLLPSRIVIVDIARREQLANALNIDIARNHAIGRQPNEAGN